jgi:tellurite resistance protein
MPATYHPRPVVVSRPGPRTCDAVIAAAAAMAMADGQAEPAEYRGLLMFLKQNNILMRLGRAATIERYAAEIGRVTARGASPAAPPERANGAIEWHDLTVTLRSLAGMEAARLVAAAAAYVAAADGVVHPGEIQLLRLLRETLGLAPATEVARP